MSKKCTPLWREAHFQVKMHTSASDLFWKLRCQKSARRCGAKHLPSQNVQNTSASDHFWKLRCRKSACRCGAKHILNSKVLKTGGLGPLLEVEMSKKCTLLWREAHFQVKMYKTPHVRATFGSSDVEKVHAVVARSTFRSQNVQNTRGSDHFWKFRCAEHTSKSHYSTVQYTPVHSTTLHYTAPHYMTLNDTATQIDR